MTKEIFETLVNRNESSILDFKASEYDFSSSAPENKKAEFIKDIISFSNTIREEKSYIIIGIDEQNSNKILKGVEQTTDDSILQQKIKGAVFPIPIFRYFPFAYQNKIFGVIEFPVKKYSKPITPVVKLKGLQPGIIYYRRNSCNDIANSLEIIEINDWLTSLSENFNSFEEQVNNHIIHVLDETIPISKTLVELLAFSKKFDVISLKEFCEREIKGYIKGENFNDDIYPSLDYRTKTVTISPFEINLANVLTENPTIILQALRRDYGAWEQRLFLQYSASKIENHIKNFPTNGNTLIQIKQIMNGKEAYIYFDKQTLISFYVSIREEAKDILMNLL